VERRAFVVVPDAGRALAIGLVALAGCGGGGDRPPAKPAPPAVRVTGGPARSGDATALGRLLVRRAAALERGDAGAYAATATGDQRARDRLTARRASAVRLRDVELVVSSIDLRGRRATVHATSRYGIRGVAGHFAAARRLTALRTRAGWRISAETSRRERHPWELAAVAERRSRHFVVLAPRGIDVAAGGLLDALETGYFRMGQVLRRPRLQRRYLVVVADGPAQARALTQRIRGVGGLAAISDTEVREEGAARRVAAVDSQRLFVVWTAFSGLDPDGRLRVVTHELTHAALAKVTSGRTPAWLLEGAALYVSEDRRADVAARLLDSATGAARRALSLRSLARPDAIARLSGAAQEAAYAYSSAAAFYIVERYGRRRYLDLYDAFNDDTLKGPAEAALSDRALRRVLRIPLARLERDLRSWIEARTTTP
jgi:hypothetical protein